MRFLIFVSTVIAALQRTEMGCVPVIGDHEYHYGHDEYLVTLIQEFFKLDCCSVLYPVYRFSWPLFSFGRLAYIFVFLHTNIGLCRDLVVTDNWRVF